jgi:hypothetical protein
MADNLRAPLAWIMPPAPRPVFQAQQNPAIRAGLLEH